MDFGSSVGKLVMKKEEMQIRRCDEMMTDYREMFKIPEVYEKRLFTYSGNVSQWGTVNYPNNKQKDRLNNLTEKIVELAQEHHCPTPDVSWFHSLPEMVDRRRDSMHHEDDNEKDWTAPTRFMTLRHFMKCYSDAWSPSILERILIGTCQSQSLSTGRAAQGPAAELHQNSKGSR